MAARETTNFIYQCPYIPRKKIQVKGKKWLAIAIEAIYTRSHSPLFEMEPVQITNIQYGGEYFLTKPSTITIWCNGANFSVILETKEIFNVCPNA